MRYSSLAVAFVLLLSACVSTTPSGPEVEQAPWVRNTALAAAEAPDPLLEEWRGADNRASCAPLTFDPSLIPSDATPRAARFGGGWGVAYDRRRGAGTAPDGSRCPDCGRSAFGIAGTGVKVSSDVYDQWPNRRVWADGSSAGWGREGGTGEKYLAYLEVAGERCLYNVWSWESEEHLEQLLESLRRVDETP